MLQKKNFKNFLAFYKAIRHLNKHTQKHQQNDEF